MDPVRAERVRARVGESVVRLTEEFPGDPGSGLLDQSPEAMERFDEFANEEPCPALDPMTQTCDLYAARPILCRTFGPPLATPEGGLAVCDLCFDGAAPEIIQECQIDSDLLTLELRADEHFADSRRTDPTARTIVAFALRE